MATDYDAPRVAADDDTNEQSLEALKARRADATLDLGDEVDPFEATLDTPSLELADEELTVRVLPRQADEFTCMRCFLVHHRSQLADPEAKVCTECAA